MSFIVSMSLSTQTKVSNCNNISSFLIRNDDVGQEKKMKKGYSKLKPKTKSVAIGLFMPESDLPAQFAQIDGRDVLRQAKCILQFFGHIFCYYGINPYICQENW